MTVPTRVRLAAVAGALILAAAIGCRESAPEPPPFKPVADAKLLMSGVVDPAADFVWQSVAITVTRDGEEHHRPTTDEEWTAVQNQALVLAESGNLLMMSPRARDDSDWMTLSTRLIDTATEAVDAAIKKDPDKLLNVGGAIYDACVACHEKYLPPEEAPDI